MGAMRRSDCCMRVVIVAICGLDSVSWCGSESDFRARSKVSARRPFDVRFSTPGRGSDMSRPLKIFLTTFYPPYSFGGDAMSIYFLSHALGDAGHHVDVVRCIDLYHRLHPAVRPTIGGGCSDSAWAAPHHAGGCDA